MLSERREPVSRPVEPPFSPILLAGLALAVVPPRLLQPLFDAILAVVRRRHPDILDRLSDFPNAVIGIDPVDLPFVLVLEPWPEQPRLQVHRDFELVQASAVIRGPLEMLFDLAEGRIDGDAAFFSRQLVFEGDTEVVLALRNAIDGAGINLEEDFAATLGPLARPLLRASNIGGRVYRRLAEDMGKISSALLGPLLRGSNTQSARIAELEQQVAELRRGLKARGRG
ncbi:MAG TPA: lipid carrier protein [Rhodospirillaceae bacterium]|nr:lipid carrier protein [Rhodospirillaceae bacterium]